MPHPDYEWVCQHCAASNPAGTGQCASCNCSAQFTVKQLQSADSAGRSHLDASPADALAWIGVVGAAVAMYAMLPAWAVWIGPKGIILIGILLFLAVVGVIHMLKIGIACLLRRK